MTPLERAQRAVEQWDCHWSHSAAVNVLLQNIKREIVEALEDERKACAILAERIGEDENERAIDPQADNSNRTGEKIAAAILARFVEAPE